MRHIDALFFLAFFVGEGSRTSSACLAESLSVLLMSAVVAVASR